MANSAAPAVITSVPTIAGAMPPPGSWSMIGRSFVKKFHDSTELPCWMTQAITATSGTTAMRKAAMISAVASPLRTLRACTPGRVLTVIEGRANTVMTGNSRDLEPTVGACNDRTRDDTDRERHHEQDHTETDERGLVRSARLTELVRDDPGHGVPRTEDLRSDLRIGASDEQGDRDRFAHRASEPDDDGGNDAPAAVGKDRAADHLPAGRAERERALLLCRGSRREHLTRDRRHDRCHHDRDDDAGREKSLSVAGRIRGEF